MFVCPFQPIDYNQFHNWAAVIVGYFTSSTTQTWADQDLIEQCYKYQISLKSMPLFVSNNSHIFTSTKFASTFSLTKKHPQNSKTDLSLTLPSDQENKKYNQIWIYGSLVETGPKPAMSLTVWAYYNINLLRHLKNIRVLHYAPLHRTVNSNLSHSTD